MSALLTTKHRCFPCEKQSVSWYKLHNYKYYPWALLMVFTNANQIGNSFCLIEIYHVHRIIGIWGKRKLYFLRSGIGIVVFTTTKIKINWNLRKLFQQGNIGNNENAKWCQLWGSTLSAGMNNVYLVWNGASMAVKYLLFHVFLLRLTGGIIFQRNHVFFLAVTV